jgi:hypothetical protein
VTLEKQAEGSEDDRRELLRKVMASRSSSRARRRCILRCVPWSPAVPPSLEPAWC